RHGRPWPRRLGAGAERLSEPVERRAVDHHPARAGALGSSLAPDGPPRRAGAAPLRAGPAVAPAHRAYATLAGDRRPRPAGSAADAGRRPAVARSALRGLPGHGVPLRAGDRAAATACRPGIDLAPTADTVGEFSRAMGAGLGAELSTDLEAD